MAENPLLLMILLMMAAVVVILMIGIGSFAKGGETNKKYGNKMMRWRLAAQFAAVLMIAAFMFFGFGE